MTGRKWLGTILTVLCAECCRQPWDGLKVNEVVLRDSSQFRESFVDITFGKPLELPFGK